MCVRLKQKISSKFHLLCLESTVKWLIKVLLDCSNTEFTTFASNFYGRDLSLYFFPTLLVIAAVIEENMSLGKR